MRFCQGHQLGRTRRILAETQAGIEKAAKPVRRPRHKFTKAQLRVAHEWHERQSIKEAGKAS